MLYRLHEWIADRVRFVQYPRLRRVVPTQRPAWGSGFSLWTKIGLAFLGVPLLILSVALFCAALGFIYLLVTSL